MTTSICSNAVLRIRTNRKQTFESGRVGSPTFHTPLTYNLDVFFSKFLANRLIIKIITIIIITIIIIIIIIIINNYKNNNNYKILYLKTRLMFNITCLRGLCLINYLII